MRLKYLLIPAFSFIIISTFFACSKSSGSGGYGTTTPPVYTPPVTTPAVGFQIKTDSKFGSIITDGDGNTLYFFSLDANGSSSCSGGCLTVWPVAYSSVTSLGTGLDAVDFASITRSDGSQQTTYKGWPLYKYSGDAAAGKVGGDGVQGVWFVAKPDYTVMLSKTQLVGNDGIKYDSTYKAATGTTLYITDDHGVTLYSFSVDRSGKNNYTKSDFSNDSFWPIVQLSTVQSVPSVFNKTDFSSITVFGKTQLTYKGWPVYRFGPDANTRGNTKGVSVPTPGFWPVMDQFSPQAPL
jgi:predicted lipoprotein with Yx(FWY)xxD motif